jgi:hypothetical protein
MPMSYYWDGFNAYFAYYVLRERVTRVDLLPK